MISAKPLVSIITIFLNEERFLGEAVESVLAQRYDAWELLLVDDGSTDGSSALARSYASRHPERIRYLEHPEHANRGKSHSRNLGLRVATGEYVTFLDADDVFLADKLAEQVATIEGHAEAAMVYGRTEYWFTWVPRPSLSRTDMVPPLGVPSGTKFDPPDAVTHFLKYPGWVPCICGVVARRRTSLNVGGFEESIQHLYEDQVFLAKLCLAGPVLVDAAIGERYRQHSASSSHVAMRAGEYHPSNPNSARLAYLTWLRDYATQLRITDGRFWKELRRELRPYKYPALRIAVRIAGTARYSVNWVRNYATGMFQLVRRRFAESDGRGSRP